MSRKTISVDNDYEVGYGKPPKYSQFKKGKSGNPKGRPPSSTFEEEAPLRRYLLESITVFVKGKKVQMPAVEVIIKSMIQKAAQGCHRSQKLLLQQSGGLTALREEAKRQKSQADEAYIAHVLEKAKEWLSEDEEQNPKRREE